MTGTESWRPMAFGFKDIKKIREPVCEPLWWGVRVLVHVDQFGVRIRDVEGREIHGWDDLRKAIEASANGSELVLDAYLIPAPDDTTGIESFGNEDIPSAGSMARQMFIPQFASVKQQKDRQENDAARLVE